MTSSDRQDDKGVSGLPCSVDLHRGVDLRWRYEQQLKRDAYVNRRRLYNLAFRDRQLRINPRLKEWIG